MSSQKLVLTNPSEIENLDLGFESLKMTLEVGWQPIPLEAENLGFDLGFESLKLTLTVGCQPLPPTPRNGTLGF